MALLLSVGIAGCTDLPLDTRHASDEFSATLKPAPGITVLSFHRILRSPANDTGPVVDIRGRAVYSSAPPATRDIATIDATIVLEALIRPHLRGEGEPNTILVDGISIHSVITASRETHKLLLQYHVEGRSDSLALHVEYRITETRQSTHTVEITRMWLSCKRSPPAPWKTEEYKGITMNHTDREVAP